MGAAVGLAVSALTACKSMVRLMASVCSVLLRI